MNRSPQQLPPAEYSEWRASTSYPDML